MRGAAGAWLALVIAAPLLLLAFAWAPAAPGVGAWRAALPVAFAAAGAVALLSLPTAMALRRAGRVWGAALTLLSLAPLLAGPELRAAAWGAALGPTGPLRAAPETVAALLPLVHALLPLGLLPALAALRRDRAAQHQAAADLGASPLVRFATLTLPRAAPALALGFALAFLAALAERLGPALAGAG